MNRIYKVYILFAHIVLLSFVLFPIIWGFRTSLSGAIYDLSIIPEKITLTNYINIINTKAFQTSMSNSLIYAFGVIILLLIIIVPAAYALSRLNFKGKGLGNVLLVLPLLPFIALLVPLAHTLNNYGMINNRISVILITTVFQVPFTCWLLRNFFKAIPKSIEEAAKIDGCSRLRILFNVILPNSFTGIISIVVFSFISTWLSYLIPYSLVSYSEYFSLAQTLLMFQGQYGTNYPELTAAAIMTIVPPLIFFWIFQKWFIAGLFGISSK